MKCQTKLIITERNSRRIVHYVWTSKAKAKNKDNYAISGSFPRDPVDRGSVQFSPVHCAEVKLRFNLGVNEQCEWNGIAFFSLPDLRPSVGGIARPTSIQKPRHPSPQNTPAWHQSAACPSPSPSLVAVLCCDPSLIPVLLLFQCFAYSSPSLIPVFCLFQASVCFSCPFVSGLGLFQSSAWLSPPHV